MNLKQSALDGRDCCTPTARRTSTFAASSTAGCTSTDIRGFGRNCGSMCCTGTRLAARLAARQAARGTSLIWKSPSVGGTGLSTQARGSDPVHARSQLQTTWSATVCTEAGTNSYPGSPGCGFPSVEVVSNAELASKAGTEYTNWGAKLVFRVVPKELSSS
jgi:hypothetical protein